MIGEMDIPEAIVFNNFSKYVRRQSLSRFVAQYELFKLQMGIKGSVVECGVHHGGSLMTWAKLSSALEPIAFDRRIFGFDTFEGFPSINSKDLGEYGNKEAKVGGFQAPYDVFEELKKVIEDYNSNRFINEIEKVYLIKGDALQTIPLFLKENPHLLISLLFMDFDLYEPTKIALHHFLPRMPKGAVLAFDELNNPWWPDETQAVLEELNVSHYKFEKFTFDPNISYIVL